MRKKDGLIDDIVEAAGKEVTHNGYVYKLRDDGWIIRCEKSLAGKKWVASSGITFDAWQNWIKVSTKSK